MGKAIGIDLGTTNSVVAFKDVSVRVVQIGPNHEDLCRSCVAVNARNGQVVIGNEAYNGWKRYAPNIVVSAKRLMGGAIKDENVQKMKADSRTYPYGITKLNGGTEDSVAIVLNGRQYTPEQISAMILKYLKEEASKSQGEITHAVITVPAYFNENQKTATKTAAEMAGLHVQQLLAEPTAAAISYGFDQLKEGEAKNLLIYDFGGGTFDLSILAATADANGTQFVEMGAGGDCWLGGDDIDRMLSNYVCKQIEKENNIDLEELLDNKTEREQKAFYAGLKLEVEKAKKALGNVNIASIPIGEFLEDEDGEPIDDIDITRDAFEAMIRPIIQRTIDLIEDLMQKTSMTMDLIDNILLVGGSSCIPLVKTMLVDKYGKEKVKLSEKPMLAIAEGAAILSQRLPIEDNGVEIPDWGEEGADPLASTGGVVFTTKHRYFIKVLDNSGKSKMEKIFDSQEPMPCQSNRKFSTTVDNQKVVQVELFNDDTGDTYKRISLAFFTIKEDLPANSDLNFTFSIDVNETMEAGVKVVSTGKNHDLVLSRGKNDESCLSSIAFNFDEVIGNSSISTNKKAVFINRVQDIIDEIENNKLSPTDGKWGEFESRVEEAARTAKLGEEQTGENNLGEVLAMILLSDFNMYLDPGDRTKMRDLLDKAKRAGNSFERQELYDKLFDIANNYSLLLHVKLFDIVAHSTSDPIKAGRASAVYEECQNALQMGDVNAIRELIKDNTDLMKSDDGTVITIGTGTQIKNG